MEEQSPAAAADTWKRLTLASGITSVIFGLVLLVWPGQTLLVFTALLGIGLVLLGLARLFGAFRGHELSGSQRIWRGLAGAALLIVGILVLLNQQSSIKFLMIAIGLMWAVSGLSEIISGFGEAHQHRAATIAIGTLSLIFGIVALVWPGPSLAILVWVTGLWLILTGLLQLWFGWRRRRRG